MLAVQTYLRENGLKKLEETFAIECNVKMFPNGKRIVIFNYDHINKEHKYHPIVQECRGLVLSWGNWEIVAKAFNRFFNLGEAPELQKDFNWQNFTVEEKLDGSLVLLYFCPFRERWCVNTRNSIADAAPTACKYTWEELFFQAFGDKSKLNILDKNETYVFELGTPYTQVIKFFEKPTTFLLSIFDNKLGIELSKYHRNWIAKHIGINIPPNYGIASEEELLTFLAQDSLKYDFEGFVVCDDAFRRIKVKSKKYVAMHYTKGNKNLFLNKRLIPLILTATNDLDEVVSYFPPIQKRVEELRAQIEAECVKIVEVWERTKGIDNQKEFALAVKDFDFAAILFEARKTKDLEKTIHGEGGEKYFLRTLKDADASEACDGCTLQATESI